MIRTSAVGIASMNDLTDASGATFANDGPLESVGILASNVQRSPAASIFALRYYGPTFRLSLRASSSAYRSSDQPFRGGVGARRRVAAMATSLQLASPSWQYWLKATNQQTRLGPEQPLEAPQLERDPIRR
jgi:hypothetical protein